MDNDEIVNEGNKPTFGDQLVKAVIASAMGIIMGKVVEETYNSLIVNRRVSATEDQ